MAFVLLIPSARRKTQWNLYLTRRNEICTPLNRPDFSPNLSGKRGKAFRFTNAWEQRKIGELSQIITGGTPNTSNSSYWEPGEIPWLSSGEVNKKRIFYTDRKISRDGLTNSSAKWVTSRSVLIALAGQGKTRGTVAINEIPLTTNQSIAAISFSQQVDVDFIYQNLEKRYEEIRTL